MAASVHVRMNRVTVKKSPLEVICQELFWKFSQNPQENACVGVFS